MTNGGDWSQMALFGGPVAERFDQPSGSGMVVRGPRESGFFGYGYNWVEGFPVVQPEDIADEGHLLREIVWRLPVYVPPPSAAERKKNPDIVILGPKPSIDLLLLRLLFSSDGMGRMGKAEKQRVEAMLVRVGLLDLANVTPAGALWAVNHAKTQIEVRIRGQLPGCLSSKGFAWQARTAEPGDIARYARATTTHSCRLTAAEAPAVNLFDDVTSFDGSTRLVGSHILPAEGRARQIGVPASCIPDAKAMNHVVGLGRPYTRPPFLSDRNARYVLPPYLSRKELPPVPAAVADCFVAAVQEGYRFPAEEGGEVIPEAKQVFLPDAEFGYLVVSPLESIALIDRVTTGIRDWNWEERTKALGSRLRLGSGKRAEWYRARYIRRTRLLAFCGKPQNLFAESRLAKADGFLATLPAVDNKDRQAFKSEFVPRQWARELCWAGAGAGTVAGAFQAMVNRLDDCRAVGYRNREGDARLIEAIRLLAGALAAEARQSFDAGAGREWVRWWAMQAARGVYGALVAWNRREEERERERGVRYGGRQLPRIAWLRRALEVSLSKENGEGGERG